MAAKVNYQFQKAERERAKLAKKEAKRVERDQATVETTEKPPQEQPKTEA